MKGGVFMDSILDSIKKMLGLDPEYTAFDVDILMLINGAFATLHQLGAGPRDGFSIADRSSKWTDYTVDQTVLPMVQQYIYLKVRTVFDPPTSSSVLDAYNRLIEDYEWRVNIGLECTDTLMSGGET
jgi:hypothetical protein